MSLALQLLISIVYYLPALTANGSAPFIKKGTPIDLGKTFFDGRRILGDGKTFEGLIIGLTFGTTTGIIISRLLSFDWILISFAESFSALVGDMLGAFIKRRLGIPRGGKAVGLDQLDFILTSTLTLLLFHVNLYWYQFIFICLLTFLLHTSTNRIAYLLKIKSVPW